METYFLVDFTEEIYQNDTLIHLKSDQKRLFLKLYFIHDLKGYQQQSQTTTDENNGEEVNIIKLQQESYQQIDYAREIIFEEFFYAFDYCVLKQYSFTAITILFEIIAEELNELQSITFEEINNRKESDRLKDIVARFQSKVSCRSDCRIHSTPS
jgi:hypothetical protein